MFLPLKATWRTVRPRPAWVLSATLGASVSLHPQWRCVSAHLWLGSWRWVTLDIHW